MYPTLSRPIEAPACLLASRPVRLPLAFWGLAANLLTAGLWLHGRVDSSDWLRALHAAPQVPETVWSWLTLLGFGWACIILVSALDRVRGDYALAALLTVVLGGVMVKIAKWALPHSRPGLVLNVSDLHAIGVPVLHGGSMPSGHAAAGAATATLMALLLHERGALRLPQLTGVAVLAALVAWSRVAVGAHWPADVLVGLALGMTLAPAGLWLARRWMRVSTGTGAATHRQMWLCTLELSAAAVCLGTDTGYPDAWWLQHGLGTLALGSGLLRLYRPDGPAVTP